MEITYNLERIDMKTNTLKHMTFLKSTSTVIITILLSSISFGQTKTEQLDDLIGKYYDYGKFNGSVLVADKSGVIYKKGFGLANMEWDMPNTSTTKHRLGSVSKQFTAMLILQLVQAGKLDLQHPISTYLPDYPKESGAIITTHHLLTHTSGIPNYTAREGFAKDVSRNYYTPTEFIKTFNTLELDFAPGDHFSYSNSGYFLLGVIIEKLMGKTYEQALEDHIFKPLKMVNSGYDNHEDILKERATGYGKNGRDFLNADFLDMSIPYAAGSLYSTVEDLYLWDQGLYTNVLLSKELMAKYFTPFVPAFGDSKYAYGWGVGKEPIGNSTDSLEVITHGGGINGFNTIISRSIVDKSLVVLLNNTGGAPLNDMTRSIRGIMNGTTYDLPKQSLAYAVLNVIKKDGIDAGLSHFKANKNSELFSFYESEMNDVGYQLMREGMVKEAATVFELIISEFPKSANAYDSYAEALMNLKDTKGAIKNYRIAIEMNPANTAAIEQLKKLGDDTSDLEKEITVANSILETYVGEYALAPKFILTITKVGNQLKTQATGQGVFDVFPTSDTEFYLKVVDAKIKFNLNKKGEVESLTLFQGGQEMVAKRVEE